MPQPTSGSSRFPVGKGDLGLIDRHYTFSHSPQKPNNRPLLYTGQKSVSDHHIPTKGSRPGEGGKGKKHVTTILSPILPEDLRRNLSIISGKRVRSNTVEGVLLFLNWASRRKSSTFEVSCEMGRQYMSRFSGYDLLPLLLRLDLIRKQSAHRDWDGRAAMYTLNSALPLRNIKLEISETSLKKLEQARKRLAKRRRRSDPVSAWVSDTLKLTVLPQMVACKLSKPKYSRQIEAINSGSPWIRSKKGRITTPVSSLPAKAREALKIEGKPVTRLDLSSSHILLLCAFLEDLAKTANQQGNRIEEIRELREFLSAGDFYRRLLPEYDRSKAKRAVQTFLNSGGRGKYDRTVSRAWRKLWPDSCRVILNQRKPIGPELMRRENSLIRNTIARLKAKGIRCIPVVDEIIVPFAHRQTAIEIFSDETRSMTGNNPMISGVLSKSPG